jgi:alpha-L-arabinofuranosidase
MIWFDNLQVVRTPNYYVQQMYAHNTGTNVLSITAGGANITGQDSLYASAVIDKNTAEVIVKVVNASDEIQDIDIDLKGLKHSIEKAEVKITCLHSNQPEAINTRKTPNTLVPTHSSVWADESGFKLKAQGNAFYVCRVKIGK